MRPLAVPPGLFVGLARIPGQRLLPEAAIFYIAIVRGTPVLAALYYIAFVGAPADVSTPDLSRPCCPWSYRRMVTGLVYRPGSGAMQYVQADAKSLRTVM